jgi:predicted N-acetyltransferase YhbS
MLIRKAKPSEFDQIYMMGFDVWAEGPEADYLVGCRTSSKYARGTWYVLENESGKLVSSLIVYQLSPGQFGIGSIATPVALRKQGYASVLIAKVLAQLDLISTKTIVFLYSDIEPQFYERFGFVQLPAEAQRYKTTTCMVRCENPGGPFADQSATPEYF